MERFNARYKNENRQKQTFRDTNSPALLRPYVQPIAILGGLLTTGVAGLVFGTLRERSGNLAGPMLAHWIVDGLMIAALWRRRPRPLEPKGLP